MSCAVRSCRIDAYRRRDLSFFSLPRQNHLKEEWLEILGIDRGDYTGNIKVCELHFKPKDFCNGKKQLKTHAVPVLRLGTGKSEPIDSDDEFMEYNSDSDPEIIEVPSSNTRSRSAKEVPEKSEIIVPKKEPDVEDVEEGRRPSRRAAREAAKKISHTVRNFGPKIPDNAPQPVQSPITYTPRPYQRPQLRRHFNTKIIPVSVDLVMECQEEVLSPVQAEALLKSQLEYNNVMKTLRTLKASNVKIICAEEPFPLLSQSQVAAISSSLPKIGNSAFNAANSNRNLVSQKPVPSSVVPMLLSSSSMQINQPSLAVN